MDSMRSSANCYCSSEHTEARRSRTATADPPVPRHGPASCPPHAPLVPSVASPTSTWLQGARGSLDRGQPARSPLLLKRVEIPSEQPQCAGTAATDNGPAQLAESLERRSSDFDAVRCAPSR